MASTSPPGSSSRRIVPLLVRFGVPTLLMLLLCMELPALVDGGPFRRHRTGHLHKRTRSGAQIDSPATFRAANQLRKDLYPTRPIAEWVFPDFDWRELASSGSAASPGSIGDRPSSGDAADVSAVEVTNLLAEVDSLLNRYQKLANELRASLAQNRDGSPGAEAAQVRGEIASLRESPPVPAADVDASNDPSIRLNDLYWREIECRAAEVLGAAKDDCDSERIQLDNQVQVTRRAIVLSCLSALAKDREISRAMVVWLCFVLDESESCWPHLSEETQIVVAASPLPDEQTLRDALLTLCVLREGDFRRSGAKFDPSQFKERPAFLVDTDALRHWHDPHLVLRAVEQFQRLVELPSATAQLRVDLSVYLLAKGEVRAARLLLPTVAQPKAAKQALERLKGAGMHLTAPQAEQDVQELLHVSFENQLEVVQELVSPRVVPRLIQVAADVAVIHAKLQLVRDLLAQLRDMGLEHLECRSSRSSGR